MSAVLDPCEGSALLDAQWAKLIEANEKLASAKSVEAVIGVLRDTAREIVQSDGIAVVIREDDKCFYAAEDAIAPLWASHRFPAASCISGWAMMNRQTVAISDVYLDSRIPQAAYRPTFVRSLVMVPIGAPQARAAIGAYWSDVRTHAPRTISKLEALGRSAAIALENVRLLTAIDESERERETALAAGRMGTWSLDFESRELRTSPTFRMNLGKALDHEIAYEEFVGAVHPADTDRLRESMERSAATGEDFDGEYRIATCDGIRWIVLRGRLGAAGGRHRVLSGVSTDITQRKLLEEQLRDFAATLERRVLERTEQLSHAHAALRQTQKLEAMGQLTRGVAHDFNNLLAPIMGSLDLLKRRGVGSDREKRLIEAALESAHRAKTLVHRLSAFGRPAAPAAPPSAFPLVPGVALLVDDEDLVRSSTADMLVEMGFQVIESHSGEDALQKLARLPHVDLLVTDHLMPAMTGPELACAVRRERPRTAIVVISGYSEAADMPSDLLHLEKPFLQADLAATVARALSGAVAG